MKIFYGVQGTGNGHITRARVMAKALYAAGMDVQFQFTGRPADKYFDMELFKDYQTCNGLTFSFNKGQVDYYKTIHDAHLGRVYKEAKELDLSAYDLIISDFEPITSWAAKHQKKTVLGIGHQYAFRYKIPRQGHDPIAEQVLKHFAPADKSIGLHWHHFDQPILPPMIETVAVPPPTIKNKIVVYLPFESQAQVIKLFVPFTDFSFHLYAPEPVQSEFEHISCHALSRDGFQQDLSDCDGIISNAGFELPSECLQLGKRILVKPIHKQLEQLANAKALAQLGYGQAVNELDQKSIEHWLYHSHSVHIVYPNTANIVVQWIKEGMPNMDKNFIADVWQQVSVKQ
ncbi:hypothetical protein BAC3_01362 [uncultured bacterium]|nr:hypothetical protein BAC3_01362 [uncultured bacterium]